MSFGGMLNSQDQHDTVALEVPVGFPVPLLMKIAPKQMPTKLRAWQSSGSHITEGLYGDFPEWQIKENVARWKELGDYGPSDGQGYRCV